MSTVLVIDDSPSIRLLMVRRLEMAGHKTIAVGNGRAGLSAIEHPSGDGPPDVVLLDAMMPGVDGPEVLTDIKETEPEVPVLVVSAMTGLAGDEAWSAADGHLAKPIDFDDLLGRIETLTSGPPRP